MRDTPINFIKGIVLLCLFLFLCSMACMCQECEYVKWYGGADGGTSNWIVKSQVAGKSTSVNYKNVDFAAKFGARVIPEGHCNTGLKYNFEGEWRSDFVTGGTLRGGVVSLLGGTEHYIGEKGYLNLLVGIAIVTPIETIDYKQVSDVRGNFAIRLGLGQGYLQFLYIPKFTNKPDERPSCVYLQIGFRGFTYQNVNWK